MNVLLVNPNYNELIYEHISHPNIILPLSIAYIASACEKEGIKVKILDANASGLSFKDTLSNILKSGSKYIGITGTAETMLIVYKLSKEIKKNSSKVVILGGPYVSFAADKILSETRDIDIIVRGEGEITFPQIITCLETSKKYLLKIKGISWIRNNKIYHNPDREFIRNIDSIAFPAYHLLPMEKYTPNSFFYNKMKKVSSIGMITSRGCSMKCYFCSSSYFWKKLRIRSLENIINEINFIVNKYNIKYIDFWDDYFTASKKRVEKFCQALINNNIKIKWSCYSRVESLSEDLILLMREAGCCGIQIGIESGNINILESIKKNNDIKQIVKVIKAINKAGIKSMGFFMIGLIGENEKTIKDTVKLARISNLDFALFNIVMPYPGTKLYEISMKNKIIDENYNCSEMINYFYKKYRTEFLDSAMLQKYYQKAYRQFYLRPGFILKSLITLCKHPNEIKTYIILFQEFLKKIAH